MRISDWSSDVCSSDLQVTLYGRNAMGGVINIITRQPGNTSSGYVRADMGNYGLQRYAFGLRTPLVENKLLAGVAGMYDQTDGFYQIGSASCRARVCQYV